MRKHQGFVPGAWARLEERVVLSPGLAAEVGPSAAVTPQVQLDLRGTVTGVESGDLFANGLRLSGRGEVAPLGQVQASGTLTPRPGEPSIYDGELTLVARRGDVFVHIHGIVGGQGGYIVTGGTGQYHGATGHGVVTYGQDSIGHRQLFALRFGDAPGQRTDPAASADTLAVDMAAFARQEERR